MTPITPTSINPLTALRQFARPRPPAERCDLCGSTLAPEHEHLVEPSSRQLHCACSACAILFGDREGARFRRVPRRVEALVDFQITDAQWESLHLPISLAFFFRSTPAGRVVAFYPSPAGSMESLLSLESWQELEAENPILRELEADVEAMLVNRVGQARAYFRVPIDECYKLVGLLRTHWRGLSGGSEVWDGIRGFFDQLRKRAQPRGGPQHAGTDL
jgi:Family of unknown function (DUF5947)